MPLLHSEVGGLVHGGQLAAGQVPRGGGPREEKEMEGRVPVLTQFGTEYYGLRD